MKRLRFSRSILIVAVALTISPGTAIWAQVGGSAELVIDLTKATDPKQQASVKDSEKFERGYRPESLAFRYVQSFAPRIETTGLVPLSPSWRTMPLARITARIEPPGKYRFTDQSITYPSGEFYARYSPDGKHWSSWQYIPREEIKDRNNPGQVYHGMVRVPYKEADEYRRLLMEYFQGDVPWKSDEEAAVRWIVKKDPAFFARSLPFIGYVQFLFENPPEGTQRIYIDLVYHASGIFAPPKDWSVMENRKGPWRFKAD